MEELSRAGTEKADPQRIRKPGAGRKNLSEKTPGLLKALTQLMEPYTSGDPMRGVIGSDGQLAMVCQSSDQRPLALKARRCDISSAVSSNHHAPGIFSRCCKM